VDHRFTITVIQSSLLAIAEEMFAVLKRTAMSPIIYEVLDAGVAITDADGRLACSGAGIPSFVGVLDKTVKALIDNTELGNIHPGDVFCTNDPYQGGVTHSSDVILIVPVFAQDKLIAWTANIAHWSDIGGATPGSLPTDAKDIFCEGLRIPMIKIIQAGKEIEGVFSIIQTNSRLPDVILGDLWAGIAAARRGAIRVSELVNRYGADIFQTAIEDSFHIEESRVKSALSKLENDTYQLKSILDDGSTHLISVTIRDEMLLVDLTKAPDQHEGPYNTSRDSATIACQMLLKVITTPTSPANDGSFRALKVLTRKGSCYDPIAPAAQGYYFEVRMSLFDMLLQCLAEGMPNLFPAGHFASICGTVISGTHPDHGRQFTMVEPQMGGWGASLGQDGVDAMFSLTHGDTYRCPAEISEARYGIDVDRVALNATPGGEGQWRGGRGLEITYRMRGTGQLSVGYSRSVVPPWGLAGGGSGSVNFVEVHKVSGDAIRYSSKSGILLDKGDIIKIRTGSGGGWGSKKLRHQSAIDSDLKDGINVNDGIL